MGIQGLDPYPPIKGVIRLGVKQEARSGSKYPKDSEYFILKDAPDVRRVYGDEPKALDIIFPSGFLDEVIPTWYKKYSASVMSGNEVKHGKLMCFGDGPDKSGAPGKATWKDRKTMPKSEGCARDQNTGNVARPCLGDKCPDAYDSKGNRVCKQTMQVFCILPLVSLVDLYVLNTSAWNSINSFHGLLRWHLKLVGPEYIQTNFYQVARVETAIPYIDKDNQEKMGLHHVVKLFHLNRETFLELNGDKLRSSKASLEAGTFFTGRALLPPPDEALLMPMDELYPLLSAKEAEEVEDQATDNTQAGPATLTPEQRADEILNDAEMLEAFAELEKVTGKALSLRVRRLGVLDKKSSPDMKRAAIDAVHSKIASILAGRAAAAEKVTVVTPEPQAPEPVAEQPVEAQEPPAPEPTLM